MKTECLLLLIYFSVSFHWSSIAQFQASAFCPSFAGVHLFLLLDEQPRGCCHELWLYSFENAARFCSSGDLGTLGFRCCLVIFVFQYHTGHDIGFQYPRFHEHPGDFLFRSPSFVCLQRGWIMTCGLLSPRAKPTSPRPGLG